MNVPLATGATARRSEELGPSGSDIKGERVGHGKGGVPAETRLPLKRAIDGEPLAMESVRLDETDTYGDLPGAPSSGRRPTLSESAHRNRHKDERNTQGDLQFP